MTISSLIGLLVPTAVAQQGTIPEAPCSPLMPGCGAGPANILQSIIPGAAGLLLQIAAGGAVLAIVWMGFRMIIDRGDESKIGEHRWGVAYALLGVAVAATAQLLVSFIATEEYGQSTPQALPLAIIASGVRIITVILNPILLVAVVIAGLKMVMAHGKTDQYDAAKNAITWAIVGAVVVNLANALVQALAFLLGI